MCSWSRDKRWLTGALIAALSCLQPSASPTVSNVEILSDPDTGLVTITFDLAHSSSLASSISVEATNTNEYWILLNEVTGEVGSAISPGTNKQIVWNAAVEWVPELFHTVKVRIRANDKVPGDPSQVAPNGVSIVPKGSFTMGSPSNEAGRSTDETQHRVTLTRSILMAKTELTWSDWVPVRDWALSHGYPDMVAGRNGWHGDESGRHPVTSMSWYDAVKWLNAKSEMEGLTPCYSVEGKTYRIGERTPDCNFDADGYRLPTEAEWEYACRAGSIEAFYTGDITHPSPSIHGIVDPNLDRAGWYEQNSGLNTHQAGDTQKEENDFGLRDMHGNIVEWCWDWYGAYPVGNIIDPTGTANGSSRLKRGGEFAWWALHCRSAYRSHVPPWQSSDGIGFRIARTFR